MFFDAVYCAFFRRWENSAGQDDREVVLAATSVRGSSLVHASQRLRQERAVVLSAVSGGPGCGGHGKDMWRIWVEPWCWCFNMGFHSGITLINMYWFWWFGTFGLWPSHHIGNVILFQLTNSIIFQRGRAQPPTRYMYILYVYIYI